MYTNDALSSILFQPITAQLFTIATSFLALSLLTILLDKRQMKSFKNINISIKVKLFCVKNVFFCFFWKKVLFENTFLKENNKTFFVLILCEEKIFFWKKNFFPLAHRSPGAWSAAPKHPCLKVLDRTRKFYCFLIT